MLENRYEKHILYLYCILYLWFIDLVIEVVIQQVHLSVHKYK